MQKIKKWIHTIKSFEGLTGVLLIAAALLAILLANSSFSDSYFHFWETRVNVQVADFKLSKNLHHWINDGLMAIFFFVIGLELKKEFIAGDLANPKNAIAPIGAAVGGMAAPALIFLYFNQNTPTVDGWGIPMATDIAFSLGLLSFVKSRVPVSLKIFLTTLAIVDDLGAVFVIAFFYTSEISILSLVVGLLFLVILIIANLIKIRNTKFYATIGIGGIWLTFLLSGVHPTIAGILIAFTIPARVDISKTKYLEKIKALEEGYEKTKLKNQQINSDTQLEIIDQIGHYTYLAHTPLQRLEHKLTPWVNYCIIPLFAFANAGVIIPSEIMQLIEEPVFLGVFFGLLVGKVIGIFSAVKILQFFKLAKLPENSNNIHLIGIGLLASIGFTMSIFITGLAFDSVTYKTAAKTAILFASAIASISGLIVLYLAKNSSNA